MEVKIGDIVKNELLYEDSEFRVIKFDGVMTGWIWTECTCTIYEEDVLKIGDSVPMEIEDVEVVKSIKDNEEFEVGDIAKYIGVQKKYEGLEVEVIEIIDRNTVETKCIKGNKAIAKGTILTMGNNVLSVIDDSQVEEVTQFDLNRLTNNGQKLLRLDALKLKISDALDNNDKNLFMQLTNEMKEIQETLAKGLTYTK